MLATCARGPLLDSGMVCIGQRKLGRPPLVPFSRSEKRRSSSAAFIPGCASWSGYLSNRAPIGRDTIRSSAVASGYAGRPKPPHVLLTRFASVAAEQVLRDTRRGEDIVARGLELLAQVGQIYVE